MNINNSFPAGYHSVIPYIVVDNVSEFIRFVKYGFNAKMIKQIEEEEGIYAEIQIGDSIIMVTNKLENGKLKSNILWVYVENVDWTYTKLLEEGAISIMEPTFKYERDRIAKVIDPFDIIWIIATYNSTK